MKPRVVLVVSVASILTGVVLVVWREIRQIAGLAADAINGRTG